jgi:hypothetical protein
VNILSVPAVTLSMGPGRPARSIPHRGIGIVRMTSGNDRQEADAAQKNLPA